MRSFALLTSLVGAIALSAAAPAAQIGIGPPGLRAGLPLASVKDLRDENLVRQRFDYSCGAAALATILRYGFRDDVSERQILEGLFEQLTDDEKRAAQHSGFSLFDLQRVARRRGYTAEGFRLEPKQLTMLGGPVIVFIEPRGYRHFAVLRGIRNDRVYLADPSRGNIRIPLYTFLDSWLQDDGQGIIFVVEPNPAAPDRPIASALTRTLVEPGRPYPEALAARELLKIGAALARRPQLQR